MPTAPTATFYIVHNHWGEGPKLVSAKGRRTAKQVKLENEAGGNGFGRTILQLEDAHDTPEAAVEAWRKRCECRVADAQQVLAHARAEQEAWIVVAAEIKR